MAITNGYATLTELKAAARIPVSDTVDDALLESAIESASRLIDQHCERRFFTNGTETRVYAAWDYYWCDIDDVAGTAIAIKTSSGLDQIYDQVWDSTDYQLEPLNRIQSGVAFPSTRIRAVGDYLFTPTQETTVEVTAVFGFATAVPTQVKQATIIEALRLYKRLDSPLGFAGFGDMGVARVSSRIDPDVAMLVAPFRKQMPGVA